MMTLEELEQDAYRRHIPIMQKEGLNFMISQLCQRKATSCLEIGAAIGYSAMMMAVHVDGLKVETIERDEERYLEALCHIQQHHLGNQIIIHHDDALTFDVSKLSIQSFDCLFIDAAKAQYQKFFEKYIPFVKKDGIVIVDNLDFHGMVFDIEHIQNRQTRQLVKKIKRFKEWIFQQEDYQVEYYPIGDGICLIQRKEKS